MNYYNLHKTQAYINNIFCYIAIFDNKRQKTIDDISI